MTALCALAVALAAAPQGGGQAPVPAGALTLAQAFERAARQNPDLTAARLEVPRAEAAVEQAGTLPNPVLSAGAGGGDDPAFNAGLSLKLPFLGQRSTAIDAAEADVAVARSHAAGAALKLLAQVRRGYVALAVAEQQTALAGELAGLAGQVAELARKKFEQGSAAQLDADQAALAERRVAQERLDRSAERETARLELAQLLGEPPDTALAAADPLLPLPQAPPLAELLARVARHPEVETAGHERAAAAARATRERVAIVPTPDVSVQVARLQDGRNDVRGGVAFELPLLSLNSGAVHVAQQEAAAAEARGRAAVHKLESDVRAARGRYEAAARRARFLHEDFLPASARLLELARLAYTLGRAPLTSVLQAQNDLAAARKQELDAASEAHKAYADLEEAVGGAL